MIKSVTYHNFQSLRAAELRLSPFTLIVGPNGSGKSTALRAIQAATGQRLDLDLITSAGLEPTAIVKIVIEWAKPYDGVVTETVWQSGKKPEMTCSAGPIS